MNTRKIGNTPLTINPIVFGGNVFGWTIDAARSFTLLDAFVDAGFNAIDTADMYSAWVPGHVGGESETIIGEWFKRSGKRDKVVLFTKVGKAMGDGSKGLRKDYILKAVEASLRRLQTDVIDLYQSHEDDQSVPLEETLSAYDTLIKQGKVRAIGASNYTGARLRQALAVSREKSLQMYACIQPEYNLYDRADYERDLEPVVVQSHIGVIPYYGLASGFLTGKYRSAQDLSKSTRGAGIGKRYLNPRGEKIIAALESVSCAHNTTMAAIALAWLLHRPSITAPIVSATTREQLGQILQAATVRLSSADIAKLDSASAY